MVTDGAGAAGLGLAALGFQGLKLGAQGRLVLFQLDDPLDRIALGRAQGVDPALGLGQGVADLIHLQAVVLGRGGVFGAARLQVGAPRLGGGQGGGQTAALVAQGRGLFRGLAIGSAQVDELQILLATRRELGGQRLAHIVEQRLDGPQLLGQAGQLVQAALEDFIAFADGAGHGLDRGLDHGDHGLTARIARQGTVDLGQQHHLGSSASR